MATTGGKRRGSTLAAFCWVLFWTLLIPVPALSDQLIQNNLSAEIGASGSGIQIYRYGSGPTDGGDFSTGTHQGTIEAVGGLEIDPIGAVGDWWNISFDRRQCFDFTASEAVASYPLRFEVDTAGTATTGADIRVVEGTNGALLTSYSEGPFPSTASVVWAQAKPLPAGVSTYCVYFDNAAAITVSDEIGTFTYTDGQTIDHYVLSTRLTGAGGAAGQIQVVSYSDANTVTDGTTTVVLNAGGLHTFTGVTADTIITSTGPIDGSSPRSGTANITPEGFADNRFSFPTNREVQRFFVRAPHGATVIEAVREGVVLNATPVAPTDGVVTIAADAGGNDYITLRSTDGTDFVAAHVSTAGNDAFVGVPWFGDSLFGVSSTQMRSGTDVNTVVQWFAANGTQNLAQQVQRDAWWARNNQPGRGNGRAYRIDAPAYVATIQQADNDGRESTAFLPQRLLSQTHYLPLTSRYYTLACPTPGTQVQVNGNPGLTCNGTVVGQGRPPLGNYAAGLRIETDFPVFLYYEKAGTLDETNAIGAKSQIPWIGSLASTPGPVEQQMAGCATWTSDPIGTTGVFGLATIAVTAPALTSASFQLSADGAPLIGPDGTPGTVFDATDVVPYSMDFAATFRVQATLCFPAGGPFPRIDSIEVRHDLDELEPDATNFVPTAVPSVAVATDEPLLRVHQSAGGAWQGRVRFESSTDPTAGDVQITTDHPTVQFAILGGVVNEFDSPFAFDQASPFTVSAVHSTPVGGAQDISLAVWARGVGQLTSGVILQVSNP